MIDGIRQRRLEDKDAQTPQPDADKVEIEADEDDSFQPPQEVAQNDEAHPEDDMADMEPDPHAEVVVPKRRGFRDWWSGLGGGQKTLFWLAIVVVLAGIGAGVYFMFLHKTPAPVAKPVVHKAAPAPKPTTEASKLTGLQVDPAVNLKSVTGVMIENSQDARPQSGLDQAGVVFEAVAEGGITRFLALFQDTAPAYIGPVRSVRPYYLQWLAGFDAPVAHVGGSPEALQDLKTWGLKDLDQFFNGGFYHRISSRYAPHNVYTSMAELNQLEANKGFGTSKYTGFLRKAEQPSKTPTARAIDFTISSSLFNVHYDYDAATNSYKRSEGGAPHMEVDQNGAQVQIAPKVVIALVMAQGIEADDLHTSYSTLGSGHVFIFQDGIVTEGTWHKNANTDQFTFTDANNAPIKLNPGQTWLTALGGPERVTYKP